MLVTRKCHRCGKRNRFDPDNASSVPRCRRCGGRIRRTEPEVGTFAQRTLEALWNYFFFEGRLIVVCLAVVAAVVGGIFLWDKYGPTNGPDGPDVAGAGKNRPAAEVVPGGSDAAPADAVRDVNNGFSTRLVRAASVWDDGKARSFQLATVDSSVVASARPPRFVSVDGLVQPITAAPESTVGWTVPETETVKAIGPDGRLVATVPQDGDGFPITIRAEDGTTTDCPIAIDSNSRFGVIRFVAAKRLLVQTTEEFSSQVSVWTVGNETATTSFETEAFESSAYDVSPDGQLVAVAKVAELEVYDLKTGQVAGRMEPYEIGLPISSCLGLAFSPGGDQLAAVYATGRLLVWDTEARRVVLDHGLTSPISESCEAAVQWLPNGRGWLLGGTRLVLADPLAEVWRLPQGPTVAGYRAIVIDSNHIMLAVNQDGATGFEPVRVPWDLITESRTAYTSAALRHGQPVQVLLNNTGDGEQKDALRMFRKSLEQRVRQSGFVPANESAVQFVMEFNELKPPKLPPNLSMRERARLMQRLVIPAYQCEVQIRARGRTEPLWSQKFASNGGAVPLTNQVSQQYLRNRTLSGVQMRIRNMAIPSYVPSDPDDRLPLMYKRPNAEQVEPGAAD